MAEVISYDLWERLTQVTSSTRRNEMIAAELLLQQVLGINVRLIHRKGGSPKLADYPHIGISISHTRDYVAIALSSQSRRIGIDMELPSPRALQVAEKFLDANERRFLDHPKPETMATLLWCAKEAAFKYASIPS